jgi:hydroxymethylpyrimidine kinase/phosphomethylpyrimidine kinase
VNVIAISKEVFIDGESELINSLFSVGLEALHLRKPNASEVQMRSLLNGIDPKYRSSIALHSHHSIAKEYGMSRLHFQEKNRMEFKREESVIYSTSFHDVETAKEQGEDFDYYFMSPICDSISKKGYIAKPMKSPSIKAVALGGICLEKLEEVKGLGYNNIALLGAIWENPESAVTSFVEIKEKWELIAKSQTPKANLLSIAGFDPSGGAGIMRDAAVVRDFNLGCFGVLTCNTIQNDSTFVSVHWLSQKEIEAQIEVLKDEKIEVVKIGLTKNIGMIRFILKKVKANFPMAKIVLDPILKTSSGFEMEHEQSKWEEIIKEIDVFTPNWEEMQSICRGNDFKELALRWSINTTICLKGGHSPHPEKDLLFQVGKCMEIIGRKEKLKSRHGSGCVYSTSFACAIAKGNRMEESARIAKDKTEQYLMECYDE